MFRRRREEEEPQAQEPTHGRYYLQRVESEGWTSTGAKQLAAIQHELDAGDGRGCVLRQVEFITNQVFLLWDTKPEGELGAGYGGSESGEDHQHFIEMLAERTRATLKMQERLSAWGGGKRPFQSPEPGTLEAEMWEEFKRKNPRPERGWPDE